jgi:hypothetical protein
VCAPYESHTIHTYTTYGARRMAYGVWCVVKELVLVTTRFTLLALGRPWGLGCALGVGFGCSLWGWRKCARMHIATL